MPFIDTFEEIGMERGRVDAFTKGIEKLLTLRFPCAAGGTHVRDSADPRSRAIGENSRRRGNRRQCRRTAESVGPTVRVAEKGGSFSRKPCGR